jgi:hypothetical protein
MQTLLDFIALNPLVRKTALSREFCLTSDGNPDELLVAQARRELRDLEIGPELVDSLYEHCMTQFDARGAQTGPVAPSIVGLVALMCSWRIGAIVLIAVQTRMRASKTKQILN